MSGAEGKREAFENWFEADAMPLESNWFARDKAFPEEYAYGPAQRAWESWQAFRAETVKEIADWLKSGEAWHSNQAEYLADKLLEKFGAGSGEEENNGNQSNPRK